MSSAPEYMEHIKRYLAEDIRTGDITTGLVPDIPMRAKIVTREIGVLAGMEETKGLFRWLGCIVKADISDGAEMKAGERICELEGSGKNILRGERVALNILSRMCGVATRTRRFVDNAHAASQGVRIAATRKTTPGFRYFEKKAVKVGGGDPHRYALDDMVLIKENHIAMCGGVEKAMGKAKKNTSFSKKIDVEVESFEEFTEVLEHSPDIVMLDNMTPGQTKKCREYLRDRYRAGSSVPLIEISGNVSLDNVAEYAPYADIISVGSLTYSYKALDLSLTIEEDVTESVIRG